MPNIESRPDGPVEWVLTRRELSALLERIAECEEVVLDLETTGLREHATTGGPLNGGVAARVALAALTLPMPGADGRWDGRWPTTYILPLSHPDSPFTGTWRATLRAVAEAMVASSRPFVNANVKFDAKWIEATTGVDVARLISWDTAVSSHLLDENRSVRLKEVAPATFGVPRWDDHDLTYPGAAEDVDLWELGEYAARDTWWTWRLARAHREEMFLGSPDDWPVTPEETQAARIGLLAERVVMPTVASLTIIEQNGILLDRAWTLARVEEDEATARETLEAMRGRYRLDVPPESASLHATSKWFQAFTEAAAEDGQLRVLERTPTGAPRWSKEVLRRLAREGSEIASLILEHRQAAKRGEYLRSWLEHADADGLVHATYRAGQVVTGRLSSADPNMQQVTKKLRPAFIPRPGRVIADLDFSQIELRVAAFLSRSEPMLEAYRRGDDLHRIIASRVTGKPLDEVTAQERQAGKASNFGLLYGQGAYGFRIYARDVYGVELSEQEALDLRAAFFETWEGIEEWHGRVTIDAHRDGFVVSPIGRVRRLPDIRFPHTAAEAERKAINSPVQGFASDLLQIAAASIQGVLPGSTPVPGVRLVATVHDSIVAELPEDRWRETVAECQRRMTDGVAAYLRERLYVDLDVPLVADASVGTRWGLSDVSDPEDA